ncbi:hypothetical protein EV426DRAFT_712645 [Tirmania nivea]|nr:hypothetical protein EV426DRAFT_712645 [Tirmania nivea]
MTKMTDMCNEQESTRRSPENILMSAPRRQICDKRERKHKVAGEHLNVGTRKTSIGKHEVVEEPLNVNTKKTNMG